MLISFQTKTYDSVTDKFMDFSFEKVGFILKTITTIIIMIHYYYYYYFIYYT